MINYDPSVFTSVNSLSQAKRIILTDEATLNTDQRWERETPHICDLIDKYCRLDNSSLIIDYGCGVGRISKELINRHHGCNVIGADISANMQGLAASYVSSSYFLTCHPSALPVFNHRADLVIAVWVLQHVAELKRELLWIKRMMKSGARLFVVNERLGRFVPTRSGWASDEMNVFDEINSQFEHMTSGHLDPEVVGEEQSQRTFWSVHFKE